MWAHNEYGGVCQSLSLWCWKVQLRERELLEKCEEESERFVLVEVVLFVAG